MSPHESLIERLWRITAEGSDPTRAIQGFPQRNRFHVERKMLFISAMESFVAVCAEVHHGSMAMLSIATHKRDISEMLLYVSPANTSVIFTLIKSGSSNPSMTTPQ
jgi:hypothetical protein